MDAGLKMGYVQVCGVIRETFSIIWVKDGYENEVP